MKVRLIILQFVFFCSVSFSQVTNTCTVTNAGFESGNTSGWILKSGGYGVNPPCPTGSCPRYGTTYTGGAVAGALNSTVSGANNRHTLMSTAGGNDPNATTPAVPVVAPGGGTYSFRLGNAATGIGGAANLSQAEAARLTFPVTNQNAFFTYRYAFFVQDGNHAFAEQPSFEVVVLDQNDVLLPCGRYFVVAGNYPGCVNSTGFVNGNNGFVYKPWTDVGLDLTGYIGQNVSIEFRTTDCLPAGGGSISTSCGSVCTLTNSNGTCTYLSGSTPCTPSGGGSPCAGAPGTHSAYCYIDAYCSPLSVQSPVFCAGAASVQICAPVGYASYSWPAGQPGLSGSPTTQCVTITNPVAGTTYTVNMVSATGCPTSTKVTLKGFDLTLRDTTICAGSAPFPLVLTPSIAGSYKYSWSPSTGLSCTTCQNPTFTPGVATATYTVTMTDPVLGCTKTKSITITIQQNTSVSAIGATVCSGVSGTLTATGQSCGSGVTYSWSPNTFLAGTTGASVTATNPTTTTTYTVTATSGSGQTATATAVLTVNPNPVITVPPATICAGTSATLTASGATTYTWSPTTGLSSGTGTSVTANPTATTTYTVTGSFATGCTGTTTVVVTVTPNPVITVPGATICPGASTPLTASGATTYTWSPVTNLSSGTGTTVTANPTVTTTYTVIGTANGCTGSTTVVVTVLPSCGPAVNATGAAVCNGVCGTVTSTTFGGTPPYSYSWNTGETTASLTPNPCPTVTTTYTITVSDNSVPVGTATATAMITVDPPITLNVGSVNVTCFGACNGQTIVIPSGGNGSFTYSWSSGCTGAACNKVCAGTYTLTATDGLGCAATGSTIVTEPSALTIVNASTDVSCFGVCDGTASVTAGGGTAPYSYSWTPSGGASANATGLCAGSYTCTVTDANGCTIITSVTINQPTKIVVTSAGSSICSSQCATLNSNSSGGTAPYTYSWAPVSLTTASVSVCPASTTVYSLTTTDANGCTGGTSVTVTVNPIPVISVPPATICEKTSTPLNASGASTYSWSPSTGLSNSTIGNPIASPAITTTYTVIGTSSFGCTGSITVTVTVNPAPVVTAVGGNACPGEPITLTASGAASYSWAPHTGLSTTSGPVVIATPAATISYIITGTSVNGCTATATATATVNPKPVADFTTSPNDANEFNPTIYFYDKSTGGIITKWHWTLGDSANTPSSIQNPVFKYPPFAHTYPIKLIVTNQFGCIDSITGTVIIHGLFTFYIPNTFTPNGDGVNDGFMPKGVGIDESDYDLWIFDRWGNLIWHTSIWGDSWDGRANHGADIAQIDTYVWKVHVKEKETGNKHNYIGHVNIVK